MFRQSLLCRTRPLATCLNARRSFHPATLSILRRLRNTQHLPLQRALSTPPATAATTPSSIESAEAEYTGPLAPTFRRLKIFSISSFTLSCTLAPFLFFIESNLPIPARVALASIAVGTSGISSGLIGWCGQPYVNTLRRLTPEENGGAEGVEMTTLTLFLNPRITRVYDPTFLIETKRAFAKWELADSLVLPATKAVKPGQEETVAETMDKNGTVLGRWIVKWGEGGEGKCYQVGNIVRYFNVHEELLH
ncbi:hypothetical protein Hypma_007627 [Hypsizygus marmoreus]|uniref:Uncharacterized protein n=1 Tax=Hypsizygus marmoreus TaxID=39966 RepID=A0A369JUU3_HYPMA|nr:hypothetical protein Hypma_007627 [Hypsizygus marmoreus]